MGEGGGWGLSKGVREGGGWGLSKGVREGGGWRLSKSWERVTEREQKNNKET